MSDDEIEFFTRSQKRTKLLTAFSKVNLENVQTKKDRVTGLNKKQKLQKKSSYFETLEAAKDEEVNQRKKLQKFQEEESKNANLEKKRNKFKDVDRLKVDEGDRGKTRAWSGVGNNEVGNMTRGLPVRTTEGRWIAPNSMKNSEETGANELQLEKMIQQDVPEEDENIKTDQKCMQSTTSTITYSVDQLKEKIALLALTITENSEENVSKLRELMKYTRISTLPALTTQDASVIGDLIKSALITLLTIFKDILPGYYIRPLSREEREAKVGKDVQKLRNYESTIVNAYREYLNRLQDILKTNRKGESILVPIAIGCLGELACTCAHFNYYEIVLSAVGQQVFSGNSVVSEQACKIVERLFTEDEHGKATSIMTRLLSDGIQGRLDPSNHSDKMIKVIIGLHRVLRVFLCIRLRHVSYGKGDQLSKVSSSQSATSVGNLEAYKKKQGHLSKAQKKELKARLSESLKQAQSEAEFSREERAKWSSDILKFLFRLYFGVLKRVQEQVVEDEQRQLLPVVLSGLARFSQYLSVEFYADLLGNLKRILQNENISGRIKVTNKGITNEMNDGKDLNNTRCLPIPTTLHIIQTVVQINNLQENNPSAPLSSVSTTAIDLKFYFDLLYRQLFLLDSDLAEHQYDPLYWKEELETNLELVIMGLFLSKRHLPAERVGSFVHRLIELATLLIPRRIQHYKSTKLHVIDSVIIYCLNLSWRLLDRHSKARAVLDSETFGIGSYLPYCHDPDLSNPFAKSIDLSPFLTIGANEMPASIRKAALKIRKLNSS